jgi:hypothetical protein
LESFTGVDEAMVLDATLQVPLESSNGVDEDMVLDDQRSKGFSEVSSHAELPALAILNERSLSQASTAVSSVLSRTFVALPPIASNCMVENWEMIQKEWDDYLVYKFGRDGRRLEAYPVVSIRQLKSTGNRIQSTDIKWGSFMSCFRDD